MEAMDKVRDEMAKSRNGQISTLGEGVTALLGIHPEVADKIAAAGKTLKGCLEAIRKAAKGGVADAVASTRAICAYYGIEADANRLAVEVNLAMLGDSHRPSGISLREGGNQCAAAEISSEGGGEPQAHAGDGGTTSQSASKDAASSPERGAEAAAERGEVRAQPAPADEFDLDTILGGL